MISATTGECYWILGTRIDIWWYTLASWVSKASVKDDQRLAAGHYEKRWHVAHRFDRPWENRGFLSWINGASGYDSTTTWHMCHRFILSQTSAILWVHLERHKHQPFCESIWNPCFLSQTAELKLLFSPSWNQWNPSISGKLDLHWLKNKNDTFL